MFKFKKVGSDMLETTTAAGIDGRK